MRKKLILRVFGVLFTAVALSACRSGRALDRASEFEDVLLSGQWNNQLAGLMRSNKVDLARELVVLRVALEAADVWRWRATPGVAPNKLEEADEFLKDAKPTVKEAIQLPNFSKLPHFKRELIAKYLKAAENVLESER